MVTNKNKRIQFEDSLEDSPLEIDSIDIIDIVEEIEQF